jgi:hypothetical protein
VGKDLQQVHENKLKHKETAMREDLHKAYEMGARLAEQVHPYHSESGHGGNSCKEVVMDIFEVKNETCERDGIC